MTTTNMMKVKRFEKLNSEERVFAVSELVNKAKDRSFKYLKDYYTVNTLSFTVNDYDDIKSILDDELVKKYKALIAIGEDERTIQFIKDFAAVSPKKAIRSLANYYRMLALRATKDFSVDKVKALSNEMIDAVKANDQKALLNTINKSWGYMILVDYLYEKDKNRAA